MRDLANVPDNTMIRMTSVYHIARSLYAFISGDPTSRQGNLKHASRAPFFAHEEVNYLAGVEATNLQSCRGIRKSASASEMIAILTVHGYTVSIVIPR